MAAQAKCPKCGKSFAALRIEAMPASIEGQKRVLPAVVLSCPSCRTALGVQIDPVAVMSGTVKGVASALKSSAQKAQAKPQ